MKLVMKLLDYRTPWTLPNIYLFTGNPVIKRNDAIVMGRGAAKEVRDHFPGIDKSFGLFIKTRPNASLAWITLPGEQTIGWFKVKSHWNLPASISLITRSTLDLKVIADARPEITFHMNYPGIGNGMRTVQEVQSILEKLPDNVLIYFKEPSI